MNTLLRLFVIGAFAAMLPSLARGGSATWNLNPGSNSWNTDSNWTPASAPNGSADTATFGLSNTNNITILANTEVNGITFNAAATNSYTFAIGSPGSQQPILTISGVGITNNSGTIPSFQIKGNFPNATMTFLNSATAGGAQITNFSNLYFAGNSTAGSANIADYYNLSFADNSNAGNASIQVSLTAAAAFRDFSNAANSVITQQDTSYLNFFGNASAGNASIGGLGKISFADSSTGGTAYISISDNGYGGNLDISAHSPPGVTIGSLSGNAPVYLGTNNLTIGSNGQSTTFAGVFNGSSSSGTLGSLTKIGVGSLSLTNISNYTGGTTISSGSILVLHDGALGTGPVTINAGGAVGGTNSISGSVTVKAGGKIFGGTGTAATGTLTVANSITLQSGSMVGVTLGPSGSHSTLRRNGGAWAFASNQLFNIVDLGAQVGSYNQIITGLASDPGTEQSWALTNPGFVGTFTYDGSGNINLHLVAVPNATANGTGWKGTVNNGTGSSANWSDAGNWDSTPPGSDERNLLFGQAYKNGNGTNYIANNDLSNYVGYRITFDNVTNPVIFALQGNAITLADFNGGVSKIENQSTVNQALNFAGVQLGGSLGWAEINAVNGSLTFGSSDTIGFGASVAGIKFFGSGQSVTFNNTINGSGKWFALTGNPANTVTINGSATTGDWYVMNGGTLALNGSNLLTTSAIRLGGDFGTTGNQDQTKGATLSLPNPGGSQTFSSPISTVPGNTSGALLIESHNVNPSGANFISGQISLDSDLTIQNTQGGTLLFLDGSIDVKNRTLTASALTASGRTTIIETLGSSMAAGGSLVLSFGTLTLQNTNNNYTGTATNQLNSLGTQINGGTLAIYGDGSLGLVPQIADNNIRFTRGILQDAANDITLDVKRNILASGQAIFDPNGHAFTINGIISGTGSVTTGISFPVISTGTVRFNNFANIYSGGTTISTGTLEVTKLANSGSSSSIGTGSSIGFGDPLVGTSGTLRYLGSGDTTNRSLFPSGDGIVLDSSGTGPINFTNTNSIQKQGFVDPLGVRLTGSNTGANTLRAGVRDADSVFLASLGKGGVGQWVLSGSSSYTGNTDVSGGTLVVQNGSGAVGNLSRTSAITVTSGAILVLAGDSTVSDRLNNNAGLTLTNGTLRLNAVPEGSVATPGLGTLTLTSNTTSFVDLTNDSFLHFAASGNRTWTGTLSVWNWNGNSSGGGVEQLLFGTSDSATSLTQSQLNTINFYSDSGTNFLGTARFAGLGSGEIIPFPPLAFWRQLQGVAADGSQDLANPAGDGVSNLLKYAFNMAPNAGDLANANVTILAQNGSAGLPFIRVDSNGRLIIDFVRRKASSNPGIAYSVETGGDLASLSPLDLSTATIVSIDSTFERVSVIDPIITASRFAKVRVTVL